MSDASAIDEAGAIQIREVTATDIIEWLNEHLAFYAGECRRLRQEIAHRDRKIELLLRSGGDSERGA